jgi:polysaccharide export outer membrane protein
MRVVRKDNAMKRYLLLLISLTVVPAFAQKVLNTDSADVRVDPVKATAVHPLQIGAGDLLDVKVLNADDELSSKLRVNENGEVTLPFGKPVSVNGLTAEQARQTIESGFRDAEVLKDPHVQVTVAEYATQGVTVAGEVKNAGVYPLLGTHGILDLISAAGGVTPNAGSAITVTHRDQPNRPEVVKIGNKPGSSAGLNVDVRPGDTIMVPRAGVVYVMGEVNKPGGFLLLDDDQLSVIQALALAQGTGRTASLNRAKIIRRVDGKRQETPIPLKKILANKASDEALLDGDILFIPGSQQKNAAYRGMEAAVQVATGLAIYGRY